MSVTVIADRDLGLLYARALLSITRADHQIDVEEGTRLTDRIAARCAVPLRLEDLLLEAPLTPDQLAHQCTRGGPFRGAQLPPHEIAIALIEDGVAIMLAKGHATEAEATRLWRFAEALGVSSEEFANRTRSVAPWFPVQD